MKSHVFPLVVSVAVLGACLAGCGKDAPKKPDDQPKKATPVPSDMVFNDFVPPSGGAGAGIVGVKTDGGLLEGGMASAEQPGAEPGAGGAEPGAAPDDAAKLHVTEPGAEPRAARKYAFVANRADKRVIRVGQSASREGGGPAQEATFQVTADFVPKVLKPTGARFELKILKVELPDVQGPQKAQAAAQLAPFSGLTGQFDITNHGEIGEVEFKADERMAGQGAEMILQSLQQALELLVPPFPAEPIGVGAKWERKVDRKDRGQESSTKHSFTLKELTADGGIVTADVDIAMPKRPVQQRGVPAGATLEVKGKGSYTYAFKLDHVASKLDGEMQLMQKIELVDPKGGKQQDVTVIKLKNHMEEPGGAAPKP